MQLRCVIIYKCNAPAGESVCPKIIILPFHCFFLDAKLTPAKVVVLMLKKWTLCWGQGNLILTKSCISISGVLCWVIYIDIWTLTTFQPTIRFTPSHDRTRQHTPALRSQLSITRLTHSLFVKCFPEKIRELFMFSVQGPSILETNNE